MKYLPGSGEWQVIFGNKEFDKALGKPLVLIGDWSTSSTVENYNSGYAEASADSMFASLVTLNQKFDGLLFGLQKNALFNSPFHFVGFGRGAVVNSEIIQRLGTFFPKDKYDKMFPDLQMTTIDPNDFEQTIKGQVTNYFDPKIQVWENVTFADNYYQTSSQNNPKGGDIVHAIPSYLLPKDSKTNLNQPDFSIHLGGLDADGNPISGSRTGFTLEDDINNQNLHERTLAWYGGTANLSWSKETPFDSPISRRKGDFSYQELYDERLWNGENQPEPWYIAYNTSDGRLLPELNPYLPDYLTIPKPPGAIDEDDRLQTEGVGNGWYFSVLGGGKEKRDQLPKEESVRTPVSFDNTSDARMRGDFAVPTLFNGNFDAISNIMVKQPIPGWSLQNSSDVGTATIVNMQDALIDWRDIDSLTEQRIVVDSAGNRQSYLQRLGIDPNSPNYQSNYALELNPRDSIIHNPFVVPEWGTLRFDLHVPDAATNSDSRLPTSSLRVYIKGTEPGTSWQPLQPVFTYLANDPGSDARPNAVGYYDYINGTYVDPYSYQIGFGENGFETFTLEVPDELRGKSAQLKFDLIGGTPVYLDNIFFQSQHLLLGNPTEARYDNESSVDDNPYATNLLIEKPQYALSYNDYIKGPNWVSWQLNKSWLGAVSRPGRDEAIAIGYPPTAYPPNSAYSADVFDYPWLSDNALPSDWTKTASPDYRSSFGLDKGHMAPSEDRNRSRKDIFSTFLTTNALPQHKDSNQFGAWRDFERYTRNDLVQQNNKELYIIAGGAGYGSERQIGFPSRTVVNNILLRDDVVQTDSNGRPKLATSVPKDSNGQPDPRYSLQKVENSKLIRVPEYTWRIAVVLEPGQSISDITDRTDVIAIITPNKSELKTPGDFELPNGIVKDITDWNDWTQWRVSVDYLEEITDFDFLSNVPEEIQRVIEARDTSPPVFLLAEPEADLSLVNGIVNNSAVMPDSISAYTLSKSGIVQNSSSEIGSYHRTQSNFSISEISFLENSVSQSSFLQQGSFQVSLPEISFYQTGERQVSLLQNGFLQIGSTQVYLPQTSFTEVSTAQVSTTQVSTRYQHNSHKISLPSSITLEQLFDIHNSSPPSNNIDKDNALNFWSTPFDLTLQITDLPTGQLAEAQITKYDTQGRPNGGTILIDADANGIGWFIDPTPLDNTEFTTTLTDTAFRATTGDAYGKYDLLTSILHEMGHLAGIISGYSEFDHHIQTVNGSKLFRGDNFTATLTKDGSHLDSKLYPFDLMNTSLSPGVRKLPSIIDLQILNAVRSLEWGSGGVGGNALQAPLNSDPLIGILNGDFDTQADWSTRGAANILNSQAILTEDSPFNSNFTQTFIIPSHAKYLQFTILDTHLGTNSFAPNDAFEVALLDARTLTPLVGTSIGLTQTDSLLNLQQTGNAYFSDKVKIAGANTSGDKIALNTPRTVKIDISNIAPGTLATLYFDLLGFGAKDGKVIIDNVMLLDKDLISPTAMPSATPRANADTATTDQAKPVLINILANDSDADGTINPSTVQIGTAPHTGSIIINSDGTLTYTPNNTFVGIDTFTYIVLDNENAISNEATVTVNINNIAPIIDRITVESNLREGTIASFSAIAFDPDDNLTYTWNFGDDSNPVTGQTLNHTFANNGSYTAILTVTDTHGASTVETLLLNVINVAPIVNPGADITTDEGTAITFNGSFIDPGILDTHTIEWDFGDGSTTTNILNPIHTYTKDGIYTATLTVTDKDGGTTSNSLTVTVNNVAPTITNITTNTNVNQGAIANFSATATDQGFDTLTYTWDFGDGTNLDYGQTLTHIFANSGTYQALLTVTDTSGAFDTQTVTVYVGSTNPSNPNSAPQITDLPVPKKVYQQDPVEFTANATDDDNTPLTYIWDFGDGTESVEGQSVTHVFAEGGEYQATLTVVDDFGLKDTKTVTVYVGSTAPEPSDEELPDWDGDFSNNFSDFDELMAEFPDFFGNLDELN